MIDISGEENRRFLEERRKKIGERIAKERKKRGFTSQGEFAEKLSALLNDSTTEVGATISQTTVSSWENGKSLPSLGKLLAMAQLFGCDCGYLLCDHDERTRDAREMSRETGLAVESIENLCFLHKWGLPETARVIDFLLFDNRERYPGHRYRSVLNLLNFFLSYEDNQNVQKQIFSDGRIIDYTLNDGGVWEDAIRLNSRIIENAVLNEIQQALLSIKAKKCSHKPPKKAKQSTDNVRGMINELYSQGKLDAEKNNKG